jgi:hypothetical protein
MITFKKTLMATALVAAISGTTVSLTGCFAGASAVSVVVSQAVSGFTTRGPVAGATVNIYAVNADGSDGALLGTTTTNADGSFSKTLSTPANQMIVARVLNGTYPSETTGDSLSVISPINGMTMASSSQSTVTINLNAVSDMAYARAKTLVTQGTPLDSAKTLADNAMKAAYGLSSAPEQIKPSFVAADLATESGNVAMVLAGLDKLATEQLTCSTAATLDALYAALASDISDGAFNGTNNGTAISLCGMNIASNLGTTQYNAAVAAVSPSVFGLTSATTDFINAQNAAVGLDTTAAGANTLSIDANNAESIASAAFMLINMHAGVTPGVNTSTQTQTTVGTNTYQFSASCNTSGTVSGTIYDNDASYSLTAGDRETMNISSCAYNQDGSSNAMTKTGSEDLTIVSGTTANISMTSTDTWGANKTRTYSMSGVSPFVVAGQSTPSIVATTLNSLSLTQDGYSISSSVASAASTATTSGISYRFNSDATAASGSPVVGKFSLTTISPVVGSNYACATSGSMIVGGATSNLIITLNSSSGYTLGLDTNKDGVAEQTITGTQTCPIAINLLK